MASCDRFCIVSHYDYCGLRAKSRRSRIETGENTEKIGEKRTKEQLGSQTSFRMKRRVKQVRRLSSGDEGKWCYLASIDSELTVSKAFDRPRWRRSGNF